MSIGCLSRQFSWNPIGSQQMFQGWFDRADLAEQLLRSRYFRAEISEHRFQSIDVRPPWFFHDIFLKTFSIEKTHFSEQLPWSLFFLLEQISQSKWHRADYSKQISQNRFIRYDLKSWLCRAHFSKQIYHNWIIRADCAEKKTKQIPHSRYHCARSCRAEVPKLLFQSSVYSLDFPEQFLKNRFHKATLPKHIAESRLLKALFCFQNFCFIGKQIW